MSSNVNGVRENGEDHIMDQKTPGKYQGEELNQTAELPNGNPAPNKNITRAQSPVLLVPKSSEHSHSQDPQTEDMTEKSIQSYVELAPGNSEHADLDKTKSNSQKNSKNEEDSQLEMEPDDNIIQDPLSLPQKDTQAKSQDSLLPSTFNTENSSKQAENQTLTVTVDVHVPPNPNSSSNSVTDTDSIPSRDTSNDEIWGGIKNGQHVAGMEKSVALNISDATNASHATNGKPINRSAILDTVIHNGSSLKISEDIEEDAFVFPNSQPLAKQTVKRKKATKKQKTAKPGFGKNLKFTKNTSSKRKLTEEKDSPPVAVKRPRRALKTTPKQAEAAEAEKMLAEVESHPLVVENTSIKTRVRKTRNAAETKASETETDMSEKKTQSKVSRSTSKGKKKEENEEVAKLKSESPHLTRRLLSTSSSSSDSYKRNEKEEKSLLPTGDSIIQSVNDKVANWLQNAADNSSIDDSASSVSQKSQKNDTYSEDDLISHSQLSVEQLNDRIIILKRRKFTSPVKLDPQIQQSVRNQLWSRDAAVFGSGKFKNTYHGKSKRNLGMTALRSSESPSDGERGDTTALETGTSGVVIHAKAAPVSKGNRKKKMPKKSKGTEENIFDVPGLSQGVSPCNTPTKAAAPLEENGEKGVRPRKEKNSNIFDNMVDSLKEAEGELRDAPKLTEDYNIVDVPSTMDTVVTETGPIVGDVLSASILPKEMPPISQQTETEIDKVQNEEAARESSLSKALEPADGANEPSTTTSTLPEDKEATQMEADADNNYASPATSVKLKGIKPRRPASSARTLRNRLLPVLGNSPTLEEREVDVVPPVTKKPVIEEVHLGLLEFSEPTQKLLPPPIDTLILNPKDQEQVIEIQKTITANHSKVAETCRLVLKDFIEVSSTTRDSAMDSTAVNGDVGRNVDLIVKSKNRKKKMKKSAMMNVNDIVTNCVRSIGSPASGDTDSVIPPSTVSDSAGQYLDPQNGILSNWRSASERTAMSESKSSETEYITSDTNRMSPSLVMDPLPHETPASKQIKGTRGDGDNLPRQNVGTENVKTTRKKGGQRKNNTPDSSRGVDSGSGGMVSDYSSLQCVTNGWGGTKIRIFRNTSSDMSENGSSVSRSSKTRSSTRRQATKNINQDHSSVASPLPSMTTLPSITNLENPPPLPPVTNLENQMLDAKDITETEIKDDADKLQQEKDTQILPLDSQDKSSLDEVKDERESSSCVIPNSITLTDPQGQTSEAKVVRRTPRKRKLSRKASYESLSQSSMKKLKPDELSKPEDVNLQNGGLHATDMLDSAGGKTSKHPKTHSDQLVTQDKKKTSPTKSRSQRNSQSSNIVLQHLQDAIAKASEDTIQWNIGNVSLSQGAPTKKISPLKSKQNKGPAISTAKKANLKNLKQKMQEKMKFKTKKNSKKLERTKSLNASQPLTNGFGSFISGQKCSSVNDVIDFEERMMDGDILHCTWPLVASTFKLSQTQKEDLPKHITDVSVRLKRLENSLSLEMNGIKDEAPSSSNTVDKHLPRKSAKKITKKSDVGMRELMRKDPANAGLDKNNILEEDDLISASPLLFATQEDRTGPVVVNAMRSDGRKTSSERGRTVSIDLRNLDPQKKLEQPVTETAEPEEDFIEDNMDFMLDEMDDVICCSWNVEEEGLKNDQKDRSCHEDMSSLEGDGLNKSQNVEEMKIPKDEFEVTSSVPSQPPPAGTSSSIVGESHKHLFKILEDVSSIEISAFTKFPEISSKLVPFLSLGAEIKGLMEYKQLNGAPSEKPNNSTMQKGSQDVSETNQPVSQEPTRKSSRNRQKPKSYMEIPAASKLHSPEKMSSSQTNKSIVTSSNNSAKKRGRPRKTSISKVEKKADLDIKPLEEVLTQLSQRDEVSSHKVATEDTAVVASLQEFNSCNEDFFPENGSDSVNEVEGKQGQSQDHEDEDVKKTNNKTEGTKEEPNKKELDGQHSLAEERSQEPETIEDADPFSTNKKEPDALDHEDEMKILLDAVQTDLEAEELIFEGEGDLNQEEKKEEIEIPSSQVIPSSTVKEQAQTTKVSPTSQKSDQAVAATVNSWLRRLSDLNKEEGEKQKEKISPIWKSPRMEIKQKTTKISEGISVLKQWISSERQNPPEAKVITTSQEPLNLVVPKQTTPSRTSGHQSTSSSKDFTKRMGVKRNSNRGHSQKSRSSTFGSPMNTPSSSRRKGSLEIVSSNGMPRGLNRTWQPHQVAQLNATAVVQLQSRVDAHLNPRTPSSTRSWNPSQNKLTPKSPYIDPPRIEAEPSLPTAPKVQQWLDSTKQYVGVASPVHFPSLEVKRLGVIATGLQEKEIRYVKVFVKRHGGEFHSTFVNEKVTHVIVKSPNQMSCDRTLKYLQGIAGKKWIVSLRWVTDSLTQKRRLPEDDYEILGDNCMREFELDESVAAPLGPRRSRTSLPGYKHLNGLRCVCLAPYSLISRENVSELLRLCGASVFENLEDLIDSEDDTINEQNTIIVDNEGLIDPPNYTALSVQFGAKVITIEWVYESISRFEAQPFDDFIVTGDTQHTSE